MDWSGFNFVFTAIFMIVLTVCLGGLTIAVAWAKGFIPQESNAEPETPMFLVTFTVAVVIQLLTLPIMWVIPNDFRLRILAGLLIVSFAFVIASMNLMSRSPLHAKGLVRTGVRAVCAVNTIGFILIILGLPGMPLH